VVSLFYFTCSDLCICVLKEDGVGDRFYLGIFYLRARYMYERKNHETNLLSLINLLLEIYCNTNVV
jgi:hypothetical protein